MYVCLSRHWIRCIHAVNILGSLPVEGHIIQYNIRNFYFMDPVEVQAC